jgi:hypothetical protein
LQTFPPEHKLCRTRLSRTMLQIPPFPYFLFHLSSPTRALSTSLTCHESLPSLYLSKSPYGRFLIPGFTWYTSPYLFLLLCTIFGTLSSEVSLSSDMSSRLPNWFTADCDCIQCSCPRAVQARLSQSNSLVARNYGTIDFDHAWIARLFHAMRITTMLIAIHPIHLGISND